MVRFLISIPLDLRDSLKVAAMQRGQSLTGYIRSILWEWKATHSENATLQERS